MQKWFLPVFIPLGHKLINIRLAFASALAGVQRRLEVDVGAGRHLAALKHFDLDIQVAVENRAEQAHVSNKILPLQNPLSNESLALLQNFSDIYTDMCNGTMHENSCLPIPTALRSSAPRNVIVTIFLTSTTTTSTTTTYTNTTTPEMPPQDTQFGVGILIGVSIGVVAACFPIALILYWVKFVKKETTIESLEKAEPESQQAVAPALKQTMVMPTVNLICNPDGTTLSGHTSQQWQGGGTYEGQVRQGLRQGFGRMVWPNGKSYVGIWESGVPHGHGLWHAPGAHGWTYNGQFYNGQRHGYGRCESVGRRIWYDGDWTNGSQNGMGETGSLAQIPVRSLAPPPTGHIWHMEQGQQREHIAISRVAPESWEMVDVSLGATFAGVVNSEFSKFNIGSMQILSRVWGICLGTPEFWLPSAWGALIITHIVEDGPLARWNTNQLSVSGSSACTIHPNSLIWRVNGVQGDVSAMVRELCYTQGRQQISLGITNPPYVRFPRQIGRPWGFNARTGPVSYVNPNYQNSSPTSMMANLRSAGVARNDQTPQFPLSPVGVAQIDLPRFPDLVQRPPPAPPQIIAPSSSPAEFPELAREQMDTPTNGNRSNLASPPDKERPSPSSFVRSRSGLANAPQATNLSPTVTMQTPGLLNRSIPGELPSIGSFAASPVERISVEYVAMPPSVPLPGQTPYIVEQTDAEVTNNSAGNTELPYEEV